MELRSTELDELRQNALGASNAARRLPSLPSWP